MISKSPYGVANWAKSKYAPLARLLSFLQFVLICVLLRRRRAISKRHFAFGSAVFAICAFAKKTINKRHQIHVESCFKALEDHPQLKAFLRPRDAFVHGGA